VTIGYSFPKQDVASRLLLGLIRDDATLIIVAPDASKIGSSVETLVKRVVPIDKSFSGWVSDGCPGVKEGE